MRWIWPEPWQMSQVGDGGARARARAVADVAEHRRVDLDVAVRAEDDVVEVDLDAQERVLAAFLPRPGRWRCMAAAEERVEDVAEAERAGRPPPPPMSYCWRCCGSLSTS